MTYEEARRSEVKRYYRGQIKAFAQKYKKGQKTVLMLPGGTGSQLDRSTKPYQNQKSFPFHYDPIWIDSGLFFEDDTLKLEIDPQGRDKGNYIVVPAGPLQYLASFYDGTETFFEGRNYNYLVFPYDWRRSLTEATASLEFFLTELQAKIKDKFAEDILPQTTLLCHSMGGQVVIRFFHHLLNKPKFVSKDIGKWLNKVITVGTPFYGTSNHMKRYYIGDLYPNFLHGYKKIAQISSTMPGPYILNYLSKDAYGEYVKAFSRRGEAPELERYPLRDSQDKTLEVDPYIAANHHRFPNWVSRPYLREGAAMWKILTKPLPQEIIDRLFNIRATQKETWVEQYWENKNYSQYHTLSSASLPLAGEKGNGDATVPFWSARHAQVPEVQIYNVKNDLGHTELMEHSEVLMAVDKLIQTNVFSKPSLRNKESYGVKPSSDKRAEELLKALGASDRDLEALKQDPRAVDPKIWRNLMDKMQIGNPES